VNVRAGEPMNVTTSTLEPEGTVNTCGSGFTFVVTAQD
jgi:hypothetical protein